MSTSRRMKREHKQVPILNKREVIFSVDVKLQTLIQFFVDNDVLTCNSCQHNVRGTCWIQFYLDDWLDISERAFCTESQDLYRFIAEECEVLLLSCDDGQPDENDEYWIDGDSLIWSASVRFQKELLPQFEALVRATFAETATACITASLPAATNHSVMSPNLADTLGEGK